MTAWFAIVSEEWQSLHWSSYSWDCFGYTSLAKTIKIIQSTPFVLVKNP